VKIIHPNHFEIVGRGLVLLSSPPTAIPSKEPYTGQLVEDAALLSKAHAIIEKESKGADTERFQLARSEFDASIQRVLEDYGIKCILMISGKNEPGVDIRTTHNRSVSNEMRDLVRSEFAVDSDVKVTTDEGREEIGDSMDSKVQGIWLDFGPEERGFRREAMIACIADAVSLINGKLGYSEGAEADEGLGDS
jgi:hypothetical protein